MAISCSPYQKVSLSNFREYQVSEDDRGNLHYVLKKHGLQYSVTDSRNNINYYDTDQSTFYNSHSFLIEDHVVIPNGANGVCVNSDDNSFIIDFGKGILVPFMVHNENNRANDHIVVDERSYSLEVSNRKSFLYFDTRGLDSSPGLVLPLLRNP